MATRVVSGVLAIAGAVAVGLGGYLPHAQDRSFEYRIFDTDSPHTILFLAIEPAAVAVAALVLGILLLVHNPFRITPGVLLAPACRRPSSTSASSASTRRATSAPTCGPAAGSGPWAAR
jgi:hypothetical protein